MSVRVVADRYHVVELLGAGGIGTVYRAVQHPLEREVALKMLRPEVSQKADMRRRFQREARAVATLSHPNIAAVYDFGVDRTDQLYMAMELVEGESLEQLVARQPLTVDVIAAVFSQVLTGLAHAHARGVIHRDIKPANILIARDESGYPHVKIVDFGIASLTGLAGHNDPHSTGHGEVVGTPHYMAPEQARGSRHISATADLYALALTLYWALTGDVAFHGATPLDILSSQIKDAPPPVVVRAGLEVSPRIETLIHQALEKKPADRVPSAAAFRTELAAIIGDGRSAQITPLARIRAQTARDITVIETIDTYGSLAPAHDDTVVAEARISGPAAIVRLDVPFVGRQDERRRLLDRAASVDSERRGLLVTIEASAGFGKSRMARWICEQLEEHQGFQVVHGAFLRDAGFALRGLREAFDDLLSLRGESARTVAERVANRASRWGLVESAELQALTSFLRPGADDSSQSTLNYGIDVLYETLFRILAAESQHRPIVMHLDDVHWGRQSSSRFLEFFAGELGTREAAVCIVVTVITGEVVSDGFENSLRRLSRFEGQSVLRHTLQPLTDDDAQELLSQLLPLSEQLTSQLVARAAGNEMHLVQLLRHLADRRLLVPGPSGWVAADEVQVDRLLPPSLAELVVARLEDLYGMGDPGVRRIELLRRGAVLGRSFPARLLERILQIENRADLLEFFDEDIDSLVDLDLWKLEVGPTDDSLTFSTSLVRDVLSERMKKRRTTRRLHQFAAEAKLAVHGDDIDRISGELVVHFEAARDYSRAMRYARIAASVASRSHRPYDAIEFVNRALSYQSLVGDTEDGARDTANELHLLAAGTLVSLGEYQRAFEHYSTVLESGADAEHETLALFGVAKIARIRGEFEQAETEYLRGLARARELESDPLILRGNLGLARVASHRGDYDNATVLGRKALDVAHLVGDQSNLAEAIWILADVALFIGDHGEARAGFSEALERFESTDHRLGIAKCHAMLAMTARAISDLDAAVPHYERALSIYRAYGDGKGVAHQLNGLGDIARFRGDFDGATMRYREAVDIFQRLELPIDAAVALSNLGIVARDSGDLVGAEDALQGAADVAERLGYAYLIAGAGLALAHVQTLLGKPPGVAARTLHRALDVVDASSMVDPDFAIPLERLAELHCQAGEPEAALRLFERSHDMWRDLGREDDRARVAASTAALQGQAE
ncbi:MAG: tetratricopeptide (TPR) repeat protein [Bradymonadia bacterium]|jgi:tetratricopeptide (TPR) repeat protein